MTVLIVILCVASFIGPIASKKLIQYDEKLNTALRVVTNGIESYVSDYNKLPGGLSEISISDKDASDIVSQGLIKYTQKGESLVGANNTFYYQLCTTYKTNSPSFSVNNVYNERLQLLDRINDNEYESYLSTYNHPEGEYCYKLKFVSYNNLINSIFSPNPSNNN